MPLAEVSVDLIRAPREGEKGLGIYRVEVCGYPPDDYVEEYTIQARTDADAKNEALRRFDLWLRKAG